MQFMKNEELYGAVDMPVWVERTAVGSSVQALLQCLPQLRIEGTIVGRLMTRMAEVLEGRHTDEEIADTDVQQLTLTLTLTPTLTLTLTLTLTRCSSCATSRSRARSSGSAGSRSTRSSCRWTGLTLTRTLTSP